MLMLTRKSHEKVVIGSSVALTIVEGKRSQQRLALAPELVRILPDELECWQERLAAAEEIFDPDLAEKPAEWQDDPTSILPWLSASRTKMETDLRQPGSGLPTGPSVFSVQTGLCTLLVAADARAAEGMAERLRHDGHRVQIAPDASSALQAARKDDLDVVLLESKLPDVDEWELAAQLREQAAQKKPFCILVAESGGGPALPVSAEAGVDLRLGRPVNFDFLRKLLQRFQRVLLPTDPSRGEERSDLPGWKLSPTLI